MKRLLAIAMALTMFFCFAGCGSDKNTDSSTPATDSKEKVVVGYVSCEPILYTDGRGEAVGFDHDLAVKIFEALKKDVVFKEVKPDDVYTAIDNGDIDCILGGFVSNIEDADGVKRSEKVEFSYDYMKTHQVVIAKINNGMEIVEGLKGKKGVVQTGTAGELFAKKHQAVDAQNKTFALNVEGVTTYGDCITEINVGNAKFAIVDIHAANIYCGGGDTIEIMPSLKSDTQYFAVGLKKGSKLKEKVNTQLEKLAADGTIAKIAKSYNLGDYIITDFSSQKINYE